MYPTLAGRAIVIIFMQAFGVSTVVRPSDSIVDPASHKTWKFSETHKPSNHLNDRVGFLFVCGWLLICNIFFSCAVQICKIFWTVPQRFDSWIRHYYCLTQPWSGSLNLIFVWDISAKRRLFAFHTPTMSLTQCWRCNVKSDPFPDIREKLKCAAP